jgi:hypothetical protein
MAVRISAKKFAQALYPNAKCTWVKVLPDVFEISLPFFDAYGFGSKTEMIIVEWGSTANSAWCAFRDSINRQVMEKLER